MSYDHSGRHSTYEQALSDVTNFRSRGIAADILCLGVPFYGRGINNRELTVNYGQIVADHYPAAEVDEIDGIYFNGRGTIARKTNLALDTGLRGIMIWEIGQDAPGLFSLLMTINEEIDAAMP
jgi:GH18 family chitinase